jgi:hypothetical protein
MIKPTSIILATENGLIDDVEYLLKKGYDLNSKNAKGETPLIIAIRNSYTDIAKLLLENGARIDGDTLLYATMYSKYEIINIILKKAIDINYIDRVYNRTALSIAVLNKNKVIVELLLEKGADPNISVPEDDTPLNISISILNPDIEIISLLLKHKANVTYYDILTAMAYRKKEIIIELLLKSKYRPTDKEIIEYLIDNNEQYSISFLLKSKLIKFPFHGKTLQYFIDLQNVSREKLQKLYEEAFIENEKKKVQTALRTTHFLTKFSQIGEARYHMTNELKAKNQRHIQIFRNKLYQNDSTRLSSRSLSEY